MRANSYLHTPPAAATPGPHDGGASPARASLQNEYAELKQRVKERGLLEKRPRYYTLKITVTLGLLVLGVVLFFTVANPALQLLNAAFLGLVFQQLSEIGHDLGHQQISRSRSKNYYFGLALVLLLGMSSEWWIGKHNRHHSNPNQLDMDPDIDISIIAFTREQALAMKGLARWIVKYQAYLLFPLMTLHGVALHNNSVTYVWRREGKHYAAEAVLITLHFILYLGLVFWRLSPAWAILWIAIHQSVYGLTLVTIFAPNHKGMPILDRETRESFLRRQILTARNVRPNPILDWYFGGLNYQIEHHLFPDMPRCNLSAARKVTMAFCRERGIPYAESGLLTCWRDILKYMHEVGAVLREPVADSVLSGDSQ